MMENAAPGNTVEKCVSQPGVEGQTNLVVGIATRGRTAILAETIAFLANQERRPDKILVAYAEPADVGDAPGSFPSCHLHPGGAGAYPATQCDP